MRSCSSADCSNQLWLGPDGTSNTYFSELHNRLDIDIDGLGVGDVNRESLNLDFDLFTLAGLNVVDQRYFQYRMIFESDSPDNTCDESSTNTNNVPCMPEVELVSIEPNNRPFGGAPAIKNTNGVDFYTINSIDVESYGSCHLRYQFSKDGQNYYYHSMGQWQQATMGFTGQSNTLAEVNAHIKKFNAQVGRGKLYWRVLLDAQSSEQCGIKRMSVSIQAK